MVEDRIKRAVELIRELLKERHIKVDKIIIFGSRIKGAFTEDSDIDVAIISQNFEGKDVFEKAEMLKGLKWDLIEKFKIPFDIVPISLNEWRKSSSLIVEYVKEGEVLG
jgi:uncharacterized protein